LRIGQAWLVKGEDGLYLKVVFSKTVEVVGSNGMAAAVDINENNIAFGSMECVSNIETGERAVRTAYFLKRRKLQSRHRLNEEPLLVKYSGRERRIEDLYHKTANQIVKAAKEAEYKARLAGLVVVYLNAKDTSSLCPICGDKISPNGYRRIET
jgi:putative transposase